MIWKIKLFNNVLQDRRTGEREGGGGGGGSNITTTLTANLSQTQKPLLSIAGILFNGLTLRNSSLVVFSPACTCMWVGTGVVDRGSTR